MNGRGKRFLSVLLCLCLCLSLQALFPPRANADQMITKVLTTTKYTPVALMDISLVEAGTSTPGVYISGYYWFDTATNTIVYDQFGEGAYRVEITLCTYEGFYFSDDLAAYLNNIPIDYVLGPDRRSVTLYRTYPAEIWAPSVIKQPRDETVDPGGFASFSATAIYTVGYQWHVYDPATRTDYEVSMLPSLFSGVTIGPDGRSTFTIENVPASMDGWHVYCTFLGASFAKSDSKYAVLHVRHAEPTPTPVPTPEPTAVPGAPPEPTPAPPLGPILSPSPSPEPTADPATIPGQTETDLGHVHEFATDWSYDDSTHWRECACGEKIEIGAHTMEWTVDRRPTRLEAGQESGVCSVCGCRATRVLTYTGLNPWLEVTVYGVGALIALTILVLIIDSIRRRTKRRAAPAPKAEGYSGRHVKK